MADKDTRSFSEVMAIIDEERDKLFEALDGFEPETEEYEAVMARLQDLQKVEESVAHQRIEEIRVEHDVAPKPVSADTKWATLASISGILLVIAYELFGQGILTSKAFALIPKVRIG